MKNLKRNKKSLNSNQKLHLDKVLEIAEEQEVKDKLTDSYIKTKMTNDANQEIHRKETKLYKKHQRKIDRDYNSYLENMCIKRWNN